MTNLPRIVALILFLVGVAGLFLVLWRRPSLRLPVLVFLVFSHIPEVLVSPLGFPSLYNFLIPFLVLTVARDCYLSGEFPRGLTRPSVALLLYLLAALASLLYAADFEAGLYQLDYFVKGAAIALLVVALAHDRRDLRAAVWGLLGAGLLMGTLTTVQTLTGTFTNNYLGFSFADVRGIVAGVTSYRAAGPLNDPNFYAQVLVVLIPLAIDRFVSESAWQFKGLAIWSGGVSLLAIIFTFSRGAWVALAIVGLWLLLRYRPRPAIMLGGVTIGIVVIALLPTSYIDRALTFSEFFSEDDSGGLSDSSFLKRSSQLESGWMLFTDSPLLGVGIGNAPLYYPLNSVEIGVTPSQDPVPIHDLFLEVAAETGVLGLLALGVLIWVTVDNLISARRDFLRAGIPKFANLVGAYALGVFAFMVCLVFLPGAYPYLRLLLFGIAAAMPVVAGRERAKRKRAAEPASPPMHSTALPS